MAWDKYPFVTLTEKGLLLDVLVQPRASRNEIVGIHDGCLKIRLAAPPVEGAANKACVEFLAEVLGVSLLESPLLTVTAVGEKEYWSK